MDGDGVASVGVGRTGGPAIMVPRESSSMGSLVVVVELVFVLEEGRGRVGVGVAEGGILGVGVVVDSMRMAAEMGLAGPLAVGGVLFDGDGDGDVVGRVVEVEAGA
jgi:hypothetical protein